MTKALSNKFANMALLCAVLVVSIHIGRNDSVGSAAWFFGQIVSSGVAGIAIPFFFFASGFFLAAHGHEPGWWPREVKKRSRTLLLPFVVWNVLFLLYSNGIQLLSNIVAHAPLSRDLLTPSPLSIFGFDIFTSPALFVLWYVRSLFLLVLVSPCIFWLLRRLGWKVLLVFFLIYALIVPGDDDGSVRMMLPFKWTFSLLGLFYFSLGAWVRQRGWNLMRIRNVSIPMLVVGLTAVGLSVAASRFAWTLPFSLRPLKVFSLAIAIFGLMPTFSLPKWLSGCAFAIFILHCFCRFIPMTAFRHHTESLVGFLVVWVVTVSLCVAVTVVMRRFLPRVTGFLFGGR